MRFVFLLYINFFISSFLFSQELKTITKRDFKNGTKEIYHVLKSNTSIKEGHYQKQREGTIIEKGNFKNNLKDSTWIRFNFLGDTLSMGNYLGGEKVGLWKLYNRSRIQSIVDYDEMKVIEYFWKEDEAREFFVATENDDWVKMEVDNPPVLIENEHNQITLEQLGFKMVYTNGKNLNRSGQVTLRFIVSSDGTMSEPKIISGLYPLIDDTYESFFKNNELFWMPASKDGQNLTVFHVLTYYFGIIPD